MNKFKKKLRKIPKKIMAIILSFSMLITNFIPLTTVFAITNEEKANLVELRMRGANSIQINSNTATINYEGGYATVSANNLQQEHINNWDYGDHTGTMEVLYTSSTSLTFNFYPEENRGVSYRIGGDNPERPENNELTINNLLTNSQNSNGYDIEFQFVNDGGVPTPTGAIYNVNFGTASWEVNGNNVTASIQGKNLTNGFLEVVDSDIITLTNFDLDTMEVRVRTSHDFSTSLHVEGNMTTCLAFIEGGGVLPIEDDIFFEVVPRNNNGGEGERLIEFGPADWTIDGEHVVATVEGIDLTHGPVDLEDDTTIHLEGFNPQNMQVRINTRDGFNTLLFVDNNNNTSLNQVEQEVFLPRDTIYFNVERIGNHEGGPEEENPPQEGNTTAKVRINGVEGTYTATIWDPELEEEREVEFPYDGSASIANETRFNINDGAVWRPLPEGETHDDIGWYLYNETEYSYDEEEGDTTIKLGLFTPWHMKFSNIITINNTSYQVSDYIDYDNKCSWLSHINNDVVGFYITVPKAEDNIYLVTVQIDPYEIKYLSEFRWTTDPADKYARDEHGETLYDVINSEYIEHAKLEFVDVNINVCNSEYHYDEQDLSISHLSDDFIDYEYSYHMQYIMGQLFVPAGTEVRIRLMPDPGYQVTDIDIPDEFTPTDTPGEYTMILPNRAEDFNITVTETEDTKTNNNASIQTSNIILPNTFTVNGNYEFTTTEVSNEMKTAIDNYADSYNVNAYFHLGLNQILNKGSNAVWNTPISSINDDATIEITLKNSITADEIIIIRNTDGNNFTTINPTSINGNTITFKTRNFGDYAIASINLTEIESINVTVNPPVPGEKVNVTMAHDDESDHDYPVADLRPNVTVDSNAPYVIDGTNWANGTCHGGSNFCNEFFNGTFDINGEYYAAIYLSAKPGYKLTLNTLDNITVNGRSLDTSDGDELFNIYDNGNNTYFIVKISPEQNSQIIKGDLNHNGKIDLNDIIVLLKKYLGTEDTTPEDIQTGDMNDNNKIDLNDIISLLKTYLGVA